MGLYHVLRVNLNIRTDISFCDRKIIFFPFILLQKKEMLQSMNNLSPRTQKNILDYFRV